MADSYILFDIDTAEDYTALLERYRRYELPTDEECEVILKTICRIKPERIRHCYKTAEVAADISRALNNAGQPVDTELVRISAILHDLAKEQPKHDTTGGQILREMGFKKVGEIVAVHSILTNSETTPSIEAKIVFLADKFVGGEKIVSIEERYDNRRRSLPPERAKLVRERMAVALQVKKELETLIGHPLEKVITGFEE